MVCISRLPEFTCVVNILISGLGWKRIRDIRSLKSITPGRVLNQEGPVNGPELNAGKFFWLDYEMTC